MTEGRLMVAAVPHPGSLSSWAVRPQRPDSRRTIDRPMPFWSLRDYPWPFGAAAGAFPRGAMGNFLIPVLLLLGSNVFMTIAWYGHLKYTDRPLWGVIGVSWGIAFFEYCLQVPANRYGSLVYSAPQLKGLQEVISLLVFAGFSTWYLDAPLKWNHITAFALIVAAAWLLFLD
jgi:uncharacterized protein (DUF486 family)